MIFSHPAYLPFLAAAAIVFFQIPGDRSRLSWLAAVSYIFYGLFEPSYIVLLASVTLLSYFGALAIENFKDRKREIALVLSVVSTFTFLIFFKYFNFLSQLVAGIASFAFSDVQPYLISVVLPVGISFYTFHAVAYVADVYVGKIHAERRILNYAVFISFFPQLNAGPIERGRNVLPQLNNLGSFDPAQAVAGLRLILLGLSLKVLFADTLSYAVEPIYGDVAKYPAKDHILAVIYFSFQVYGDFAGYSLMAIGSGRIFGIKLMQNFRQPFLADSVPEFWRTWHISLSTWLQDYVFTPLRLKWRQHGMAGLYLSLGITFVLAGIWHGAGWKYVLFGCLHSCYMIVSVATIKARNAVYAWLSAPALLVRIWRAVVTFALVAASFVLFRASSVSDAAEIYKTVFDPGSWRSPPTIFAFKYVIVIGMTIAVDLIARSGFQFSKLPIVVRWATYYGCIAPLSYAMIMRFGYEQPFIYFQF